jgi:hypothetical protein
MTDSARLAPLTGGLAYEASLHAFWIFLLAGVVGAGILAWGIEDRKAPIEALGSMILAVSAIGIAVFSPG